MIAPAFPLFPAIAGLFWSIWPPFVSSTMFWLHVVLLVFSLAMTAYNLIQLRGVHAARISDTENEGSNVA